MRHRLHSFRVYVLLFLFTASMVIYVFYQQVHYAQQRRDFIHNISEFENDQRLEESERTLRKKRNSIQRIKNDIKQFNTNQKVFNSILGPIHNGTYVIVIQCHSNIYYLKQLLYSLRKASFISKALLIFSHDHYSYQINKLIKSINFAKYMQIFYPYSVQLHPNVFPGAEPKSCVKGFSCMKKHARDPLAAQSKHHWWWQANQIFNHLNILKNFSEPILFLEDNNYVLEDALVVYKLLTYAKNIHCPFCEMISLSAHEPNVSHYTRNKSIVTLEVWTNTMPRTAIAFDRKVWDTIKLGKEEFCSFNDSNWDASLKHVGAVKWEGNIYLTAIDGPRVFRLEKCDKGDPKCNTQFKMNDLQKFIKLISKQLFPYRIKIKVMADDDFNSTGSGYWSDKRDHLLCMHVANQSVWY